jgi:hygromycin-B 7''-O-kinase
MAEQEYSQRLGSISPEQFQMALDRMGLGTLVSVERVPFGLFGQNVFLTSTKGQFVLRGAPHYVWQFPTERFFTEQLHQKTRTPVPCPYLLEPSTGIFGWSFAIMPRLPGLHLQDERVLSRLTLDDRSDIARALARMLVEVQTLSWEHPGAYDPETDGVQPFATSYREWVVQNIWEKVADAQGCNDRTTPSDVRWVESVIAGAMALPQSPYEPSVVLGDYGEHNVVVVQVEDGWEVSGVFDLMTAHAGDGRADLCLPVMSYLKASPRLADLFVQEYLGLRPPQPGFAEQQQLFMLDLELSFWRYWHKHGDGPPEDRTKALTLEQWARPGVDYWARFAH